MTQILSCEFRSVISARGGVGVEKGCSVLHPPRFPVCYQGTGVSRGCLWAAPAPRGPENPPAPQVSSGQTSFQTLADTENCTENTTRVSGRWLSCPHVSLSFLAVGCNTGNVGDKVIYSATSSVKPVQDMTEILRSLYLLRTTLPAHI